MAQLGRALGWGPRGRKFKSCHPDHFYVPVAQLDRVLPSEGRGRKFDSCRVRHIILGEILKWLKRHAWKACRSVRARVRTPLLRHIESIGLIQKCQAFLFGIKGENPYLHFQLNFWIGVLDKRFK